MIEHQQTQEEQWPWKEASENVTMALVSATDVVREVFGPGNVNPGLVTRVAELVLKEVDTLCQRAMAEEAEEIQRAATEEVEEIDEA